MNVRIAQIVARLLSKGLIALMTYLGVKYGEGQIESIVEPIAAGIGAAAMFALDIALHKWQERFKISTGK